MPDAYDVLPYTAHAYAESHPDNLRVVAALSGFGPLEGASSVAPRVLELGCGRGGNLLPMAAGWPEARFVGVDRSEAQIRDATTVKQAASLDNITFLAADFTDLPSSVAGFDFVLCHGVYSWIPPAARLELLARVRASLAPRGVAYVSFNTLPGWYDRLAARDFLRFAARASSPHLPVAPRDALAWLAKSLPGERERASYRAGLAAVHHRLSVTDAAYLTHEYLAEDHHPVYVATFLEEAARSGLTYLGDALPRDAAFELLPDDVRTRAASMPLSDALMLADFARNTAFRRALLVRSDTARDVSFEAPRNLDPFALAALRVASRLVPLGDAGPSEVESFSGDVVVQASGALRRALHRLAAEAPRSAAVSALAHEAGVTIEALATDLYDLWLAAPGLDLHAREPRIARAASARPLASPVARWHALEDVGGPITNAWHQEVALGEPALRFVLSRLDGTRDAEALAVELREWAARGARVSPSESLAVVRASLEVLSRAALLEA